MDKAVFRIMASIALVFICFCATGTEYVSENRAYCTGISADESVVILLNTFRFQDKSIESEGEEKSLANCVRDGMTKVDSKLRIIPAREFRRTIFPNKGFLDSPRSFEDLFSFLSNPDAQNRVVGLGVRYVIILIGTTSETKKPVDYGGGSAGAVWHREWTQNSSLGASVLDVKYLRRSGSVTMKYEGTGMWVVGCCAPAFPLVIPFGFCKFPRTEAEACFALGEAVMKFLIDGRDMVPTPELGTGSDSGGRGSDIQSDIQTPLQPASGEDLRERPQEPGQHDKDSQN
jgi:hypothetical protein